MNYKLTNKKVSQQDRDTSHKTVIMNISNENTMQLRPHQNEALAKMRLRIKRTSDCSYWWW